LRIADCGFWIAERVASQSAIRNPKSEIGIMGLIKSQDAPTTLAAFSMKDVEQQARALLLAARRKAEQLLVAAQEEGEQIRNQAKIEGFEEGRQAGTEEGLRLGREVGRQEALTEQSQALRDAVAALVEATQQIEQSRAGLEAEALQDVVELSLAVARRVTKRQAELDPLVLQENLRDALRLVVHAADLRIAIHPSQRAALEEALPALQLEFPQLAHVALIDDAGLAPGGCRVHTRGGKIDAGLDAQLDRIVADLMPTAEEAGVTS
jgi:flagellar assembly protein FliH